jgi:hypothetical protein
MSCLVMVRRCFPFFAQVCTVWVGPPRRQCTGIPMTVSCLSLHTSTYAHRINSNQCFTVMPTTSGCYIAPSQSPVTISANPSINPGVCVTTTPCHWSEAMSDMLEKAACCSSALPCTRRLTVLTICQTTWGTRGQHNA